MATTDPDTPRGRPSRAILAGALLIAALVAAGWIHRRFVKPDRAGSSDVSWGRAASTPDDLAADVDGELQSLLDRAQDPAAGAEDPGSFPPPPGATMLVGDTRRIDGQTVDRARYVCDATIDEIRTHYDQLMAQRGFNRAGTTRRDDGSETIVYVSPAGKAIVGLRKPRPDNTIDSIVVMFFRP